MTKKATLNVSGMKCGGCENNVTTKLKALDGVWSVIASSSDKQVNVEFEENATNLDAIKDAITAAGYTVMPNE